MLSACIIADIPPAMQRETERDIRLVPDFYCHTSTSGEGLGQISGNKHYAYNGTLINKMLHVLLVSFGLEIPEQ